MAAEAGEGGKEWGGGTMRCAEGCAWGDPVGRWRGRSVLEGIGLFGGNVGGRCSLELTR